MFRSGDPAEHGLYDLPCQNFTLNELFQFQLNYKPIIERMGVHLVEVNLNS